MKTVSITTRVNPDLKAQAEFLCEQMGLTLSTVYTMLLKAIVRTGSIPFEIKADSFYSEANQQHLRAAIARLEDGEGEEHDLVDVDNMGQ
ncbi:MAG: type II toxin-antitoxin system RelB/DinJ family antitoxin [Selenomonadaceae bacterium]|nr:type II toxin-antitoxin system RelB/DinJ family antitoxin [Selenomonadaceae bacterium]MBQ1915336.1 type II toxin-antitoxin system RelB/DinJ family antitoxin [Selenomonadaceae bacterium]MBQ3971873.1 type II toxin-antitoxin system RelB/DinJ family antitoxin [Selenomonadaceae bacterium]